MLTTTWVEEKTLQLEYVVNDNVNRAREMQSLCFFVYTGLRSLSGQLIPPDF